LAPFFQIKFGAFFSKFTFGAVFVKINIWRFFSKITFGDFFPQIRFGAISVAIKIRCHRSLPLTRVNAYELEESKQARLSPNIVFNFLFE
jgi:hypothetical protein